MTLQNESQAVSLINSVRPLIRTDTVTIQSTDKNRYSDDTSNRDMFSVQLKIKKNRFETLKHGCTHDATPRIEDKTSWLPKPLETSKGKPAKHGIKGPSLLRPSDGGDPYSHKRVG